MTGSVEALAAGLARFATVVFDPEIVIAFLRVILGNFFASPKPAATNVNLELGIETSRSVGLFRCADVGVLVAVVATLAGQISFFIVAVAPKVLAIARQQRVEQKKATTAHCNKQQIVHDISSSSSRSILCFGFGFGSFLVCETNAVANGKLLFVVYCVSDLPA